MNIVTLLVKYFPLSEREAQELAARAGDMGCGLTGGDCYLFKQQALLLLPKVGSKTVSNFAREAAPLRAFVIW